MDMLDQIHISDDYEYTAQSYEDLLQEVQKMEDNSRWDNSVIANAIQVHAIGTLLEVPEVAKKTGIHEDLLRDTISGAEVYVTLPNGKNKCIRTMGRLSLCDRANISGSALGRESPEDFATTMNLALNVSRGSCLTLTRYGKIAAFHSDAAGGYLPMPISELMRITDYELRKQMGKPVFLTGTNSHDFTKCIWSLPDVKDKLVQAYLAALPKSVKDRWNISAMVPGVRLTSSDTATSAASLVPVFITNKNHYLRLSDGILPS